MEDSDEFRWALKVVIKRQMRDLLQQLHDVGEEMAVLAVNVTEGTASHFGTSQGEWFLSEQKNIKQNFLKYCQSMSKKSGGKPNLAPLLDDLNATIESCHEEKLDADHSSTSQRRRVLEDRLSASKTKKPKQVVLSSKKPGKAVIRIKVPKGMITSGTSDKDLSGMVGRLLDQELKAQKSKSDEADSQNKFSSLLEAANIAKEQVQKTLGKRPGSGDMASIAKRARLTGPTESPAKAGGETPRSLRSGRAVSSKFLEGVASLKKKTMKGGSEGEDHSDMEQTESVNVDGAELETVSAQLSKELEQMTLPVLERIETATSEGEVFDDREIQDVVGQTKDEGNTVYVIRGPKEGEDESDVELTLEIPSLVGKDSEGMGKAEMADLAKDIVKKVKSWDTHAEDIVEKVKSSETQTPITVGDPDYSDDGDSEDSVNHEEYLTEIEIDDMISKSVIKNKRAYKERMRWVDTLQKKCYACKYCNKLFGRTSDCKRHEQTCPKSGQKEALIEISAKEIQSGKMQISEKEIQPGKVGMDEKTTGAKTWAEILTEAEVDTPANITNPSLKGIYQCPECPKKLKGSSNFYSHYRMVHENYRPFTCDVCKNQFGTRTNFTNHQIAVHTRKCDSCGSYVAETEPWGQGITKHHERNILCGSCNKVVVFVSGNKILPAGMVKVKSAIKPLKTRNRKTAEKQTYACEVCDKLFYKLFDCRRHQQKHATGKFNMCDVCGRQFQHATSLQQHQKIHDESFTPPHCSICNKDFQLRKSFVEHMLRKHGIDVSGDKNQLETIEAGTIETGVQYVVATTETVDAFGNNVIQM